MVTVKTSYRNKIFFLYKFESAAFYHIHTRNVRSIYCYLINHICNFVITSAGPITYCIPGQYQQYAQRLFKSLIKGMGRQNWEGRNQTAFWYNCMAPVIKIMTVIITVIHWDIYLLLFEKILLYPKEKMRCKLYWFTLEKQHFCIK